MDQATKARVAKMLLSAASLLDAAGGEGEPPADMWEALDWASSGWLGPEEMEKLKAEIQQYPKVDAGFLGQELENTFLVEDKIIEVDGDEFSVSSKHDWVAGQMESWSGSSLKAQIEEKLAERFNEDFQAGPVTLWHATDSGNLESIMSEGLRAESRTRGLTNRNVGPAIFTYDQEELARYGSYGDAVLAIDTKAMKRDGVDFYVEQEPAVVEREAAGFLASMAELDNFDWDSGGDGADDPATVILSIRRVAPKYLKVVK